MFCFCVWPSFIEAVLSVIKNEYSVMIQKLRFLHRESAVYFRRGLTCTIGLTNDLIVVVNRRLKTVFRRSDVASLYVDGV